MDQFVALSAALTGIGKAKLAPALDPIDIKQTYFDLARKADPSLLDHMLLFVAEHPNLPPDQLADLVLKDDRFRFFARSIMLAWYLGSWYKPEDLKVYAAPNPPDEPIDSQVISQNAYTKGWAWSVAQAHPMGFSTNIFCYWSESPPSLGDYIGGQTS
jgi:hypothetical protein